MPTYTVEEAKALGCDIIKDDNCDCLNIGCFGRCGYSIWRILGHHNCETYEEWEKWLEELKMSDKIEEDEIKPDRLLEVPDFDFSNFNYANTLKSIIKFAHICDKNKKLLKRNKVKKPGFYIDWHCQSNIAKAIMCLGISVGCNSWSKKRPTNFGIEFDFLCWHFGVTLNWSYND